MTSQTSNSTAPASPSRCHQFSQSNPNDTQLAETTWLWDVKQNPFSHLSATFQCAQSVEGLTRSSAELASRCTHLTRLTGDLTARSEFLSQVEDSVHRNLQRLNGLTGLVQDILQAEKSQSSSQEPDTHSHDNDMLTNLLSLVVLIQSELAQAQHKQSQKSQRVASLITDLHHLHTHSEEFSQSLNQHAAGCQEVSECKTRSLTN